MPAKAGLAGAVMVQAAADLADAKGVEAPTLGELVAHLGVRMPSLYNHIAGLRSDLALLGVRNLNVRLSRAAIGKSGSRERHDRGCLPCLRARAPRPLPRHTTRAGAR
jgi:hypothetical protein